MRIDLKVTGLLFAMYLNEHSLLKYLLFVCRLNDVQ